MGNKERAVYIIYRITDLHIGSIGPKYYYGYKKCTKDPKGILGVTYFSSSSDEKFINNQITCPDRFKYTIVKIFTDRKKALECEIYLHNKFDVGVNPRFINKAKQTSSKFDTSGKTVVIDLAGNTKLVNCNHEKILSGEYSSVHKGLTPAIDKTTNKVKYVTMEEYANDSNLLHPLSGRVTVINKEGETLSVYKNDPRYISGELVGVTAGKTVTVDKDGKTYVIEVTDPRLRTGELVGATKNRTPAIDSNGNAICVNINDPRFKTGEIKHPLSGRVTVINKEGETLSVYKNDPRYISGELVSNQTGMVVVKDKLGVTMKVSKSDPRYISGELVGATKGKGWYHDPITMKNCTRYPDDADVLSGKLVKGRFKDK